MHKFKSNNLPASVVNIFVKFEYFHTHTTRHEILFSALFPDIDYKSDKNRLLIWNLTPSVYEYIVLRNPA